MAKIRSVLIAAVIVAAGCSKSKQPGTVTAASTPGKQTVAVAKTTMEPMAQELVLTAEFKPYQEVEVMAKVSGYIKKMYVDVGDWVKQGQVLATLEVPEMHDDLVRVLAAIERSKADVDRAKNEVQRAEAAYQLAKLTSERLTAVFETKPGMVAQQEVDDAQGKARVAASQVDGAKSALSAALKAVEVNEAEAAKTRTLESYLQVVAPFAGVVSKRYADNGGLIQAGTSSHTQAMPLVRLSQNSTLRLVLPVPESAVSQVRLGAAVEIRVQSLGRTFPGRVSRISERVNVATRTMDTEVDVENPKSTLVPGMFAEAVITLKEIPKALAVPVGAVDHEGEKLSVMLVKPDNRLERREIKGGIETPHHRQVIAGLEKGDMVVIGRRDQLRVGQLVAPKEVTLEAAGGK
ncbi:MAG: efflux RND transporter periplasmic adaptor subunit [Bryobacterales bacterium]|nr:efflux RND transporter periplasmic adaptor subunit [Bryobacterales bacterium]